MKQVKNVKHVNAENKSTVEKGEKAWGAAIRELKEETGLDPKRIFVADHVSRFYETHGNRVNLVPVFGIEADSDLVLLSSEHSEYKWVGYDDAYNIIKFRLFTLDWLSLI